MAYPQLKESNIAFSTFCNDPSRRYDINTLNVEISIFKKRTPLIFAYENRSILSRHTFIQQHAIS